MAGPFAIYGKAICVEFLVCINQPGESMSSISLGGVKRTAAPQIVKMLANDGEGIPLSSACPRN